MSRSRSLSVLILIALVLTSCSRRRTLDEAPELIVKMESIPAIPSTGPGTLLIQISNGQGEDIGELTIDVRGDMSHAGMTPVIVTGVRSEAGMYSVPFEWSMAGDWIITITASLPDGRMLMRVLPVQVAP